MKVLLLIGVLLVSVVLGGVSEVLAPGLGPVLSFSIAFFGTIFILGRKS